MPEASVPDRVRYEKSWWIASEFLRRHPHYTVIEDHSNGIYDLLILRTRESGAGAEPAHPPSIMLNREGTVQVHGNDHPEYPTVVATWQQIVQMADPHEIIKRIEAAAHISPPRKAPTTSVAVLVYRTLSAALTRKLNDRAGWDIRVIDDSGHWIWTHGTVEPGIGAFKSAIADTEFQHQRANGHAWFLLRGSRTLAAVSKSGECHFTAAPSFSLMDVYSERRRLDDVVDKVLDHIDTLTHPS